MFPKAFDRTFELWRYSVGHAQLLLRSTKSDEWATRVDVGFKNVEYIQLPTLMNRLAIEVGTEADLPPQARQALDMVGKTVFILSTDGVRGFVVAGYGGWIEDEGDYSDPSKALPDIG